MCLACLLACMFAACKLAAQPTAAFPPTTHVDGHLMDCTGVPCLQGRCSTPTRLPEPATQPTLPLPHPTGSPSSSRPAWGEGGGGGGHGGGSGHGGWSKFPGGGGGHGGGSHQPAAASAPRGGMAISSSSPRAMSPGRALQEVKAKLNNYMAGSTRSNASGELRQHRPRFLAGGGGPLGGQHSLRCQPLPVARLEVRSGKCWVGP